MAARINLLFSDLVLRSNEHPLLRNSEKYLNFQNPSKLAYNEFGHGKSNTVRARENEGTEREAQGVGRDMSCPRKLFLDERKSLF